MKLEKKPTELISLLVNSDKFTEKERSLFKTYSTSHQLYILMLSPFIPLCIRKKAVVIYGSFINPSYKLPISYIHDFLDAFVLSKEEYLTTLDHISKTKLITY